MKSILEELYMGNIGFDFGRFGPDFPFVQAARRKLDSMEKLDATLNEALTAHDYVYMELGMKAGARLIYELLIVED